MVMGKHILARCGLLVQQTWLAWSFCCSRMPEPPGSTKLRESSALTQQTTAFWLDGEHAPSQIYSGKMKVQLLELERKSQKGDVRKYFSKIYLKTHSVTAFQGFLPRIYTKLCIEV